MARHSGGRILLTGTVLLFLMTAPQSAQRSGRDPRQREFQTRRGAPAWLCGTTDRFTFKTLSAFDTLSAPPPDGEPLSFRQEPAILFPDYTGTIRLAEFLVAGDVSTVNFKRPDTDSPGAVDTWNRVSTRTIAGRIVSVFEPSWPGSDLEHILRFYYHGYDYPALYWGAVQLPGADSDSTKTRQVVLRISSLNIPRSNITKLDDTVQFASNVVNLVIPTFGDARVQNADDFDQVAVAHKFYEQFQDNYDSLAIIPQAAMLPPFAGAHQIVQNDVNGIGIPIGNQSAAYGSGGALKSVEVFPNHAFTTNEVSDHEITHQWADHFNWATLGGITPAGHQPGSHSPLWSPGETLLGAVLFGARRVQQAADSSYEIGRTPVPVHQHPIQLYAMGLLPSDQVQPVVIFQDQGQFDSKSAALPDPGTKVNGATKSVTINDILGLHGARSGSTPTLIRRATIIVSRGGLLAQEEMDYWNFFAQRLEDPDRNGVVSADGFVSFDRVTSNSVDLQTDIVPKSASKITQRLEVNFPHFGTRDWVGVEFDQPVPTTVAAGLPVKLTGKVTATDRSDFSVILVRFSKVGQADSEALKSQADISRSGKFTLNFSFNSGDLGVYLMDVFLFWPGAPGQFPRSSLSPFIINPN